MGANPQNVKTSMQLGKQRSPLQVVSEAHRKLGTLAAAHTNGSEQAFCDAQVHFLEWLTNQLAQIQAGLKKGSRPASRLPLPTRRALRWLAYLAEPQNLAAHLAALENLNRLWLKSAPPPDMTADFRLYNSAAIIRARHLGPHVEVTLHEGLATAAADVFETVIRFTARRPTANDRAILREFAGSTAFYRVARQLDPGSRISRPSSPQGQTRHLADVFARVNRQYFAGQLPQPDLAWSRREQKTTLGTYRPQQDLVTLNRLLDRPHVPEWVVDFVMYHELLHKALGVQNCNGRRLVHTAEFKTLEKQFREYRAAQDYIKNGLFHL